MSDQPGNGRPPVVLEVRAVGLRLGDLFRDPSDGTASIVKTVSIGSWAALTAAFLAQSWYTGMNGFDFVMYAMASTVCSGGPLASTVLSLVQPRLAGVTGKYGNGRNGHDNAGGDPAAAAEPPPKR